MAYALGLVTYKDFAGVSRSFRTWVSDDGTPVVLPGETLFDHLGNVLSIDVGAGVGALKTVAMTAAQVIGFDDHATAVTASSNRPPLVGYKAVADLSSLTNVTTGQVTFGHGTLDGRSVTIPHAHPGDRLASTPVALTSTTANVALVAAQAAGIKIALIGVAISNKSVTDAEVHIKDGTTTIGTFPAPHSGGMVFTFPFPLVGTAATVLNAASTISVDSVTVTPFAFKTKL